MAYVAVARVAGGRPKRPAGISNTASDTATTTTYSLAP